MDAGGSDGGGHDRGLVIGASDDQGPALGGGGADEALSGEEAGGALGAIRLDLLHRGSPVEGAGGGHRLGLGGSSEISYND